MTGAVLGLLVLIAGVLLLLGIASSKFSARVGVPVLVLFLTLGMLAGSDGIGGIEFSDYSLANNLASLALALILFDGGLRTSVSSVRSAWAPALSLSTLGVIITSGIAGLAASWILDISILHGLLLGAIIGSTDAAAVFSLMRTSGLKLPDRLSSTLEVESGSNDPMAIFLTIGLISILTETSSNVLSFVQLFILQFGVGGLVGVVCGVLGATLINRINLDYPGMYPLLAIAMGFVSFGLASVLGGSGFLAVYLAGISLAHHTKVFRRGILMVHDAAAWLGQIILFIMLGLLSFPARLIPVIGEGLMIAAVLILVARPIATVIALLPFRFRPREIVFLCWVGLKGAVPITLATFPLMSGIEGSDLIFDAVFFVVLVSAVTQGWSLPTVARWLGLGKEASPSPPLSVEINALRHVDGEIVDYTVAPSARVAGQALRDLALPDGVSVTLVVRGTDVIMPRGATRIMPDDHVFIGMHTTLKPLIDRLFDPEAETPPLMYGLTLSFHENTTVGQLHRFFGIPGPTWSNEKLGDRLNIELVDQEAPRKGARLGPFILSAAEENDYVKIIYQPEGDLPEQALKDHPK